MYKVDTFHDDMGKNKWCPYVSDHVVGFYIRESGQSWDAL